MGIQDREWYNNRRGVHHNIYCQCVSCTNRRLGKPTPDAVRSVDWKKVAADLISDVERSVTTDSIVSATKRIDTELLEHNLKVATGEQYSNDLVTRIRYAIMMRNRKPLEESLNSMPEGVDCAVAETLAGRKVQRK